MPRYWVTFEAKHGKRTVEWAVQVLVPTGAGHSELEVDEDTVEAEAAKVARDQAALLARDGGIPFDTITRVETPDEYATRLQAEQEAA